MKINKNALKENYPMLDTMFIDRHGVVSGISEYGILYDIIDGSDVDVRSALFDYLKESGRVFSSKEEAYKFFFGKPLDAP